MTPWVRLAVVPGRLPRLAAPALPGLGHAPRWVTVTAGLATARALLVVDANAADVPAGFDTPAEVEVTQALLDRLPLPLGPRYRLRDAGDRLELGPVIGLLLGNHPHRYTRRYMAKFSDRLGIYGRLGGVIGAFSAACVDWSTRTAHGLCYDPDAPGWRHGAFPLPGVVYRRNFHTVPEQVARLWEVTGGRLFNSHRPTKWDLYAGLRRDPLLAPQVPDTLRVQDGEEVGELLGRHGVVILKPNALSRGRGICILKHLEGRLRLVDYRGPSLRRTTLSRAALRALVADELVPHDYLVQQYVELARVGSSVVDLRVVMQRLPEHGWTCTGMECRVSPPGEDITNVARGGRARAVRETLAQALASPDDVDAVVEGVMALAHGFCRHMDREPQHFAEWGLDLGVDVQGRVWFLEANVFPSFKGFRQLDKATYLRIRHAPLEYAASLAGFGVERP